LPELLPETLHFLSIFSSFSNVWQKVIFSKIVDLDLQNIVEKIKKYITITMSLHRIKSCKFSYVVVSHHRGRFPPHQSSISRTIHRSNLEPTMADYSITKADLLPSANHQPPRRTPIPVPSTRVSPTSLSRPFP
jgi:hypothetical protein